MDKGYRLQQWIFEERLGVGGMAEVWLARHSQMNEFAAIKFLLPAFASNKSLQDRFLLEGRSQFVLRHPNIVRTHDFITQDDRHFLVMEYIKGSSLFALANAEGILDAERVLRFALPILDALAHAHDQLIIHRDVKLQNILLDEKHKPYLTDFGIAKALRPPGAAPERGQTGTGMFLGSVECMSPEQIQRPSDVDARSDIYSFGCVLYDLLAGRPPFISDDANDTNYEIMRRHVSEPPRPLRELNPDVPPALEAAVMRALEKDRSRRFDSCRDMALALTSLPKNHTVIDRVHADSPFGGSSGTVPPRTDTIYSPGAGNDETASRTTRRGYTPTTAETTPKSDRAPASKQWLVVVVGLLVVALGFAAFRFLPRKTEVVTNEPKQEEKKPDIKPEETPKPDVEAERLKAERLKEAERLEAERQRLATVNALADQKANAAQVELDRLKSEARDREQKLADERARLVAANEALSLKLKNDRDEADRKASERAAEQQRLDAQRLADEKAARLADEKAAAEKRSEEVRREQLAKIPPRGTFKWSLNLRKDERALITFTQDGAAITSSGQYLGGAGLPGIQTELTLTRDSLQQFEVTQPLMRSTGFRQLELKCKQSRCNQTVEVTWTRN